MNDLLLETTQFVQSHAVWAAPIAFWLSFGESLAFLSLLLPATMLLIGIGVLIGAGGVEFWPVWLAASIGAAAGDWLSYEIGYRLGSRVGAVWPLSRYPALLPQGHSFFKRWGTGGVFIGRFFGPLRASVPLAAGICRMPPLRFQLANVGSALLWAAVLLAPGNWGVRWIEQVLP